MADTATPPNTDQPPPQLSPGEQQAVQQTPAPAPPAPSQQPQADMPALPAPSAPSVKFSPKRQGLAGVLDEVRNWVAGTQGTAIAYDPAGNRYVTHPALTAQQQWARVGANAFRGAAAGWAAGKGAGNQGAAAAAGVQAQQTAQEKAQQQQETEAEKGAAAARQARMDAASDHIRGLQIAQLTFQNGRQGAEAMQHDVDWQEKQEDRYIKDLGGTDFGVYTSNDWHDLAKIRPDFAKLATAHPESIIQIPQTGPVDPATGKSTFTGNRFVYVPPDKMKELAPSGTKAQHWVGPKNPNDPNDAGHIEESETTDPMTWGDLKRMGDEVTQQAQQDAKRRKDLFDLEESKTKAKAAPAMTQAELRQKQASAEEAFSTAALNRQKLNNMKAGLSENGEPKTGLDPLNPADHEEIIRGMLDGSLDITKTFGLSRSNKPSPVRAQYEAEAHRRDPSWNMQKFGAMQRVIQQYASTNASDAGGQIMSFNYFMGHAGDFLAQVQRLRNSNSPLLNQPMNYLAEHLKGDPAIPEVYNAMQTMAQESQRFLEGKTLTDQDNQDLKKKINLNMTPAMLEGIAKQMMHSGVIRLGGLNHSYRTTVGHDFDGLLDPNSAAVLNETAKGTDYESQALKSSLNTYLPKPGQQGAPPRPPNVPDNYVYKNGAHGLGWYAPTPGAQ